MAAVLVVALSAVGCETPPTREQGGMIVGGILGGVLGAQVGEGSGRTAATILGTLAGAAIGGAVGRSMTDTDRLKAAHTLESVRTGVPARWVNPDTGNSYVVVPTRTFDQAGAPCRDYTIDATIGGAKEKVVGTACRQPDGSWRVVQ
jgi:surface antigen